MNAMSIFTVIITVKFAALLLSDMNKILNNEQIDSGVTLKSKPIMQKTLYFLKNEMYNEKILTI